MDIPFIMLPSNIEVLKSASTIIFDIETIPLPLADLVRIKPFKESEVKYGNRTKEESRKLYLETAREEHVKNLQKGAALKSTLSKILAIGYGACLENEMVVFVDNRSESEILDTWWEIATHAGQMIGWNSNDFDLPYICQRTMISPLHSVPDWTVKRSGRAYYHPKFIDAMKVFSDQEKIGLNEVSKSMGFEGKYVTDKLYYQMFSFNQEQANQYLAVDIEMTYRTTARMGLV